MEEERYLPIGTICTLKGINNQIMIVGYYSISYNGTIKIYDYSGVVYPEGILLKNRNISFNHTDISHIDYLGYKNDKYELLNKKMLSNREKYSKDKKIDKNIVMNFEFDENGVVIYDPIHNVGIKNNNTKSSNTISNINNPFQEKYNKELDNIENKKNWSIFGTK